MLRLLRHPALYTIVQFQPNDTAAFSQLLQQCTDCICVTKTKAELSLIVSAGDYKQYVETNGITPTASSLEHYTLLELDGTYDLSLVGILAPILQVLKDAKVPIFVTSTYNTDFILVPHAKLEAATKVLMDNGYSVVDAE